MSAAARRAWTVVVFATIGLTGAAMMARGSVVPELREAYLASEFLIGMVAPAFTVGYLVAIAVVGFGAAHRSPRLLVAAGLVGAGLSILAMGRAPILALFVAAVLLRGVTTGVVRGRSRPLLSHFYPDRRGRVFSYFDMTWAVGAMLGPALVVGALALGDWRLVYYLLGSVTILLGLVAWRLPLPDADTDEEPMDVRGAVSLVRRPEVLGMVAVMFVGCGVEGGLFFWLPTFARQSFGPTLSSLTLSVLIAGYVPGRAVYGRLGERFGHLRTLVVVLVALVPVFLATFWLATGLWILAGVAAIGALVSGIFPLLITYATDAVPHHSGPVTALAAVSSSLGVGLVPGAMGLVVGGSGATTAMQLLVIPLGLALLFLVAARVAERRREVGGTATTAA